MTTNIFNDLELYDKWLNELSPEDRMECIAYSRTCTLGPSIHVYDCSPDGRNADCTPRTHYSPCGQVVLELARRHAKLTSG
jgi:hypothetical protein